MSRALPSFTEQEVASHNTSESLWVSIDGQVYDLTNFQDDHPGGQDVLLENAGKDASAAFASVGHSQDAVDLREGTYLIGTLQTNPPAATTASGQKSDSTCGRCCDGQRALRVGAVIVGVAAIGVGIYFAYRLIKK